MDCAELAGVAPELALEVLDGRQRAAALAHLDSCGSCRQLVSSLAADTDLLLLLAPPVDPPPGFADRVVASLSPGTAPAAPRPRRRARVLAGRVVASCLALAALALGVARSPDPAVATADLRSPGGETVGTVVLQPEPSAALFLTMPGWARQIERYGEPGDTYALRITRAADVPRLVPLDLGADASWATTLDIDPDAITNVAVVDSQGDVWCEADI